MSQLDLLFEKIYSYNTTIQSALHALKEELIRQLHYDKDIITMNDYEKVITQQPKVWRPLIAAVMAQLNAQAKLIQGLANIMQYQRSNLGDGTLLFDYTNIILSSDAFLLYKLEYLNFTVSMGKTPLDWSNGGEGLFFSLYFDQSWKCGFHVGIAQRPLVEPGFLKDPCTEVRRIDGLATRVQDPSPIPLLMDAVEGRRKERESRWHEMYPALSKDRVDADAEIAGNGRATQSA